MSEKNYIWSWTKIPGIFHLQKFFMTAFIPFQPLVAILSQITALFCFENKIYLEKHHCIFWMKIKEPYHKSKEEKREYREDNKEQIKEYGWNFYKSISKEGKKRK